MDATCAAPRKLTPAGASAPAQRKENTMKTVQEYIDTVRAKFLSLSASYRAKLVKQAREHIAKYPGSADHSNFWRHARDAKCGLSARQVIETNHRARSIED
jgi:hypothetical protein